MDQELEVSISSETELVVSVPPGIGYGHFVEVVSGACNYSFQFPWSYPPIYLEKEKSFDLFQIL